MKELTCELIEEIGLKFEQMKFGEIWKSVFSVCVSGKWKSDDSGIVYS